MNETIRDLHARSSDFATMDQETRQELLKKQPARSEQRIERLIEIQQTSSIVSRGQRLGAFQGSLKAQRVHKTEEIKAFWITGIKTLQTYGIYWEDRSLIHNYSISREAPSNKLLKQLAEQWMQEPIVKLEPVKELADYGPFRQASDAEGWLDQYTREPWPLWQPEAQIEERLSLVSNSDMRLFSQGNFSPEGMVLRFNAKSYAWYGGLGNGKQFAQFTGGAA